MQVPPELIVWMLGANGVFLSFLVHMVIGIQRSLTKIAIQSAVDNVKICEDIKALKRHTHFGE